MSVYDEIFNERLRQNHKWGRQSHIWPDWACILMEEIGEAIKLMNEDVAQFEKDSSFTTVYPTSAVMNKVREELIQAAAVLVAWIEDIDSTWEERHVTKGTDRR